MAAAVSGPAGAHARDKTSKFSQKQSIDGTVVQYLLSNGVRHAGSAAGCT